MNSATERLFDTVETFYSPEIPAGEQWFNMIEEELSNTDFGIICITKGNQKAQWLNHEAGACLARYQTAASVLASSCLISTRKTTLTGRSKTSR